MQYEPSKHHYGGFYNARGVVVDGPEVEARMKKHGIGIAHRIAKLIDES